MSQKETEDQQREEGVNFTSIEDVLDAIEYPITADELVDRYGDREIERTNAEPITIEELFGPMGETSFESEDDLQTMLLGQMPRDSEGRTGYSDRGGSLPTETDAAEEAEDATSADEQEGEATDRDTTGE